MFLIFFKKTFPNKIILNPVAALFKLLTTLVVTNPISPIEIWKTQIQTPNEAE